ncbi:MAG: P-loop NTPase [Candidatus Brockarchaeota archaeon]|nr:P-loop NTPase [Candidatus Brockarchaeota archaeon]
MDFRLQMVKKRLGTIDKVLLVASGKGGVGKSVVAATLANHISGEKKVGLLDLDLHGPTLPLLLNHGGRLKGREDGIEPVVAGGVRLVSLGLLTSDKAMPLKGEVKRDLIIELFSEINWGRLNYLIVDLPPGTGDEALVAVRLTAEKASAILVSTPSPHSLGAVRRMSWLLAGEGAKIAGLVLNMAYMADSIGVKPFGSYDVEKVGEEVGVKVVAELPLEPEIASSTPINMGKLSEGFRKGLERIYEATRAL